MSSYCLFVIVFISLAVIIGWANGAAEQRRAKRRVQDILANSSDEALKLALTIELYHHDTL